MLILVLVSLFVPIEIIEGKKCSELSCCAGYRFDSSGNCVVCPSGLHGVQCSTPCAKGFYGELCTGRCECSDELCNATVGCLQRQDTSLPNTSSLSTAIPITIGVLGLFGVIITFLGRQKTMFMMLCATHRKATDIHVPVART
ncbi:scavenger receptor class F member 1-like isoform X1 [Crassostrea angulata]|uniref:scavenger receptor class F member 1-like isoform X1 n=1 Tax=Magallana angulata TaxID=2784310 RepID=UPI0022B1F659|nr:scavenger receptor class F member 1-like isoform X1 [Crassostrea angulata]